MTVLQAGQKTWRYTGAVGAYGQGGVTEDRRLKYEISKSMPWRHAGGEEVQLNSFFS